METRLKEGKLPVYKGNPKLWQVLDDSYQPEARKKAQLDIKDSKVINYLSLNSEIQKKKEDTLMSDAEEDFIEIPIKTKFYE
jgi:hypothetical protein